MKRNIRHQERIQARVAGEELLSERMAIAGGDVRSATGQRQTGQRQPAAEFGNALAANWQ